MPHSRFNLPILYLAIFILSLTGIFVKLIPLDAVSIVQLRSLIAAFGLAFILCIQKRSFRLAALKTYIGVYLLGLLLGAHWVTFFHSMQISTVAVGILSVFSFPMITILLEPLFTKHRLKNGDIVAGVIMLTGLLIMVGHDLTAFQGPVVQGVLWGILSALLFSLRILFQKYRFEEVSSDSLMFHQVVAVALMLALFVDYPQVSTLTFQGLINLGLLGIFITAGGHTLYVISLKKLPAKSVALISCLQPMLAVVFAWYFLNEIPGLTVLVGGGIVLSVAAYESLHKRRSV